MGYYGGKGLPFFFTTLPGVVKTDDNKKSTGAIAGQVSYQWMDFSIFLGAANCYSYHLFRTEFQNPQNAGNLREVSGSSSCGRSLWSLLSWPHYFWPH